MFTGTSLDISPTSVNRDSSGTMIEMQQVQSNLENENKAHFQQAQRQQSMAYRQESTSSTPNSPMALLTLSSNCEKEMNDVIDDIISLESSYNEDVLGLIESGLQINNQLPVSSSFIDVYNNQGLAVSNLPTSSSCAANIKRELTAPGMKQVLSKPGSCGQYESYQRPEDFPVEAEVRALAKERQKKDNHNLTGHLTDCAPLSAVYPRDMRWNKGTILKASVDYIRKLQQDQQRTKELECRQRKLEHANGHLLLRIQELEIQARAHGLTVASSTSVCTSELLARAIKQEPVLGECPPEMYPHCSAPDMSPPTTMDLNNGVITFDPVPADSGDSGSYVISRTSKMKEMGKDKRFRSLSPSNSLLSSISPDVSNNSNRCCSSMPSMEEKQNN
ncbi:Microphthalmia-associated transcription factor [Oryzias melastigma]|uniref:Microphthalmia-associated transcription factor n=1 Tax=Oryzias melastigma TaxID=30732 RepID=A0A834C468_ORYME|nr:Microphthalmia-associated transcription factor [Oryzias melastigma]